MNTRFKFALIRHLNSDRHQGFALPMAMMVGLVILVVGATLIIRAQSDQSKVVAQTTTSKAAAIAEAGAAQYINFLNNNRGLIPYPSCVTSDSTTGACTDGSGVKSWYQATNIPNIVASPSASSPSPSSSPSCTNSGSNVSLPANYQTYTASDIQTTWANSTGTGTGTGWRDLGNGAGQYRIVAYKTYTDTSASTLMNPSTDQPTAVRRGRLIVEGRVNQSGTGATATTDQGRTGIARLEFTIPVTATTTNGSSPSSSTTTNFPGLWAQNFNFGNNNSANAQVWDSSACSSGTAMPDARILNYTSLTRNVFPDNPLTLASGVTDTATANNGNKQLYDGSVYRTSNSVANPVPKVTVNQAFPSLPNNGTYPTTSTPALVYGPRTTQTGTVQENSLDCSSLSNVTFPRAGDKDTTNTTYGATGQSSTPTYVYRCSGGMSIGDSAVTLGRLGTETLVFYVNGTFNASANGGVFPVQGTNSWSRGVFYVKNDAQIKANGNVGRLLAPDALQFYVYNSGNMNPGFDMGGNGSLYAFIFAPTSIGLSKGTEDLSGALWIKSYEVDGNNKVWQSIFDDSRLMVTLPNTGSVTTYQLDGSPNQWRRVEAN
ncbi:MAG: hypothetical protein VKL42_14330 [Snowella sp.]|nr:hypothetical protein [Snowella sp.]